LGQTKDARLKTKARKTKLKTGGNGEVSLRDKLDGFY
jgi:hypothetical protein